jgi:Ca2+-binding RTX toxin-like protein
MTTIGTSFLQVLPTDTTLVVRTVIPTVTTGTTQLTQPIVLTASKNQGTQQEALVVDTNSLPRGSTISLSNVEFCAILGEVRLVGGDGSQVVIGDSANQFMVLGADDDLLHGGGGNDTVGSKGGNDQLYGDEGDDSVVGGLGNDTLQGGAGNDLLVGGQSDAGNWRFTLDALNGLQSDFVPVSNELADSSGVHLSGAWPSLQALPSTNDSRFAFTGVDINRVETITLLYQAVFGHLPDATELSYWATQAWSLTQLATFALDAIAQKVDVSSLPTVQSQMTALINWVWGAGKASDDLVTLGSEYITNGGTWGVALDYLVHQATFKTPLLDSQGRLPLSNPLTTTEIGWSSDTGNDNVYGDAGDDVLVGGRGTNRLDGGSGNDSVVVSGNAADYRVLIDSSGQIQLQSRDQSSSNSLLSIETVKFADKTVNTAVTNVAPTLLKTEAALLHLVSGGQASLEQWNSLSSQASGEQAFANAL